MKAFQKAFLSAIKQQQTYVAVLGACTALATTYSLSLSIAMAVLLFFTLMFSMPIVSLLRKWTTEDNKILVYFLVSGGMVSLLQLLAEWFFPIAYEGLGIFAWLVAVNCLLITRIEVVAAQEGVIPSLGDAMGSGLAYGFFLGLLGLLREVIGTGSLHWFSWADGSTVFQFVVWDEALSIPLMIQPIGAFLMSGLLIAFLNKVGGFRRG